MAIKNTDTTDTTDTTEAEGEVEQSLEDKMLSAMDEGLSEEEKPSPEKPEESDDDVKAEETAEPKPVEADPDTAKVDEATVESKDEPETKAENKELDDEVTALGLKEKAEARFRSLSTENATFKPMREALETAGIKDVADIPTLKQRADNYDEMIALVRDTGTNPEQYGSAMDLLDSINKAAKGDAAAASRAYDMLMGEIKHVAPLAGKEIPGIFDPLDAHDDLKQAVEDGDIDRKYALEIAKQRSTNDVSTKHQQAETERTTSEQAQAQAKLDGVEALNALGAELSTSDGDRYKAKAPYLIAALKTMTERTDPKFWRETAMEIYNGLPDAPVAAPVKKPPSGIGGAMARPALDMDTNDLMTAMNQGIAAAS